MLCKITNRQCVWRWLEYQIQMKRLIVILCTLTIGCATSMESEPIFRNGSTGLLHESSTVSTYEIPSSVLDLPLSIKLPDDFKGYKYATLIASKTKNTGGWIIKYEFKGNMLSYCIESPALGSAVTMALSTPYLIVAHDKQLKISEDQSCK